MTVIQTLTTHTQAELPAAFVARLTSEPQYVRGIGWLAVNASGAICYAVNPNRCSRLVAWTSRKDN